MKPRIGLSSCLFPADPQRPLFKGKELLFMERSMGIWLTQSGALTYLVPPATGTDNLADYVRDLDGLLLQGGTDVSPQRYGEEPMQLEWRGDAARDEYEIELFMACYEAGIPVLGICRGIQVINVALGGSLYQDINTQVEGSLVHRNWDVYEQNTHRVVLEGRLAQLYQTNVGVVNSIHHQGLKEVAEGFVIEARCPDDGTIEAMRHTGASYVAAVQWHPEFQDPRRSDLLPREVIANDFIAAATTYRNRKSNSVEKPC